MDLKKGAKSFALDFAMRGPESIARSLLGEMNFGFEPLASSKASYPQGKNAAACISVDYDHFGNASTDTLKFEPVADMEKLALNRAGTRLLVDLSRKHLIPMTWAICGKSAEADMASYKKIVDSNAGHEIGVHTYSHVDVSACTEQELEIEVSKCLDVLNLSQFPKTFIFPWNRVGHFDKLKQMGFQVYRGKERVIGPPRLFQELLNIRPTFYAYQDALEDYQLVTKFIDLCIERHCVFHLWTHPWSIVMRDDAERFAEKFLEPVFRYLGEKRKAGLLSISTMGEISSSILPSGTQSLDAMKVRSC